MCVLASVSTYRAVPRALNSLWTPVHYIEFAAAVTAGTRRWTASVRSHTRFVVVDLKFDSVLFDMRLSSANYGTKYNVKKLEQHKPDAVVLAGYQLMAAHIARTAAAAEVMQPGH
jgi:hypothetical protein